MYSRWVWSISDWTCVWILVPMSSTSSSRVRISERRRRRLATSTSSSSDWRSSVGIRSEPAIRCESALGSSRLATAICSSSGRYGTCSMMRENICWTLRASASSSGPSSTTSGSSSTSATRYGSVEDQPVIRTRCAAWTSTRSEPSGTLSMRATVPATPMS